MPHSAPDEAPRYGPRGEPFHPRNPSEILVLCFLPNGRHLLRIEQAGAEMKKRNWGSVLIHEAGGWKDLQKGAQAMEPDVVIVDPCTGTDGSPGLEALSRLIQQSPSMPVVAYPSGKDVPVRTWLRLGRHGLAEVIDETEDTTPYLIAYRLRRFGVLGPGYEVIDSLADVVPERWRALLKKAYPHAHRGLEDDREPPLSVPSLANMWLPGAKPFQLNCALRYERLPPAGWLIRWLIALHAVVLRPLRDHWEAVAFELGFGSAKDLRRFTKRLADLPPNSLDAGHLLQLVRSRIRRVPSRPLERGLRP